MGGWPGPTLVITTLKKSFTTKGKKSRTNEAKGLLDKENRKWGQQRLLAVHDQTAPRAKSEVTLLGNEVRDAEEMTRESWHDLYINETCQRRWQGDQPYTRRD